MLSSLTACLRDHAEALDILVAKSLRLHDAEKRCFQLILRQEQSLGLLKVRRAKQPLHTNFWL